MGLKGKNSQFYRFRFLFAILYSTKLNKFKKRLTGGILHKGRSDTLKPDFTGIARF